MFQSIKPTSAMNVACQAPHLGCKVNASTEQIWGKQQDPCPTSKEIFILSWAIYQARECHF